MQSFYWIDNAVSQQPHVIQSVLTALWNITKKAKSPLSSSDKLAQLL